MDEDKNVNNSKIPAMAKARGSNLPRLGVRTSKLPKSKTQRNHRGAFNSVSLVHYKLNYCIY